jgi:hypothetical protein
MLPESPQLECSNGRAGIYLKLLTNFNMLVAEDLGCFDYDFNYG